MVCVLSPPCVLPVPWFAHQALVTVGVDPRELTEADEFFGTAALKSYNTFVRPRPKQLAKVKRRLDDKYARRHRRRRTHFVSRERPHATFRVVDMTIVFVHLEREETASSSIFVL